MPNIDYGRESSPPLDVLFFDQTGVVIYSKANRPAIKVGENRFDLATGTEASQCDLSSLLRQTEVICPI